MLDQNLESQYDKIKMEKVDPNQFLEQNISQNSKFSANLRHFLLLTLKSKINQEFLRDSKEIENALKHTWLKGNDSTLVVKTLKTIQEK